MKLEMKKIEGKRIIKYVHEHKDCDNVHHLILEDGSEIVFSHEDSEGDVYYNEVKKCPYQFEEHDKNGEPTGTNYCIERYFLKENK